MSHITASLERSFAVTERALNSCGYVPVLSTLTGALRLVAGLVQTAVASTFSFLLLLAKRPLLSTRYGFIATHGLANVCRGFVEMVPLLGNMFCYTHDRSTVRMVYAQEADDLLHKLGSRLPDLKHDSAKVALQKLLAIFTDPRADTTELKFDAEMLKAIQAELHPV